jgi:hypothetical protein
MILRRKKRADSAPDAAKTLHSSIQSAWKYTCTIKAQTHIIPLSRVEYED